MTWTVGLRAAGFRAMDTKTMTRTNHDTDSEPRNLSSQDSTAHSSGAGTTEQTEPRTALRNRLATAGLDVERFVPLRDGTKKSRVDHTDPAYQYSVAELDSNYGVMPGDGLVIVDIDDYDDDQLAPDWVTSLPPTFTVETPHGGEHKYYAVSDSMSNSNCEWGEIRAANWYVVGPGSELDSCSREWHDCSVPDQGAYTVAHDLPIASIGAESLPVTTKNNAHTSTEGEDIDLDGELPEINEDKVAYAKECIREFQADATQLAFDDLLDVLNGGTGTLSGLRHDDTIDRDKADLEACWLLYGVMKHTGESSDRARGLTNMLYTYYCVETPYMKDGRPRKWLRDEKYRRNRLDSAVEEFDTGAWSRWRRRSTSTDSKGPHAYTGEYSEVSYNVVLAAVDLLVGVLPPELVSLPYDLDLRHVDIESSTPTNCHKVSTQPIWGTSRPPNRPTKVEVIDLAQQIDPGRSADTHEEVLKRLQNEHGQVNTARMDSTTWVYYPSHLSDPPDACYVKCNGEKREPNSED